MMRRLLFCAMIMGYALAMAAPALAQTCAASVSALNFGNVSVRSGAVNSTSGTARVTCTGGVVGLVGVCLRFGPGSGGAAGGLSPRMMRRGDGTALSYELRSGGNGAAFGTLSTLYFPVTMVLGSGSATIPIYGDVVSASIGVGTGNYRSDFSGAGNISLTQNVASCATPGTTVGVPDFAVTADVVDSCDVDVTALDFGNIPAALNSPVTSQATINVRCTAGTRFEVLLDNGTGPGATASVRRMRNLLRSLDYGLYLDPGYSQIWGGTPSNGASGIGAGANVPLRVYGKIFAGQTAATGVYTDTVVVTVAY